MITEMNKEIEFARAPDVENQMVEATPSAHVGEAISLRGRLVDRSNGQPIPNMTVMMAGASM